MRIHSQVIHQGDVALAAQSFGDPEHPAILLTMGATASMLWWPEELCEALAETGRFVIRYDNRDTGQSTTYEPGEPPYSMDDMADDALAILDGFGIECAHLVGMSLGGMIAQLVTLKAPSRAFTLTAISSSAFDEDDPDLPPMEPKLLAHFATMETLDWSDRAAVVAFQVESSRISSGENARFDEGRARHLAESEYDRAINPQSALNHSLLTGGESWAGHLGDIQCPVLVIHGKSDPILSFAHGQKLAASFLKSRLVALEAGHELNPKDWPQIVAEIERHTALF
ncbi:alpha/beta hydrolase [bacterium]|nr:MAG: alpha/beta hydrolase [bacterium]